LFESSAIKNYFYNFILIIFFFLIRIDRLQTPNVWFSGEKTVLKSDRFWIRAPLESLE
jgi:hypothetical protein